MCHSAVQWHAHCQKQKRSKQKIVKWSWVPTTCGLSIWIDHHSSSACLWSMQMLHPHWLHPFKPLAGAHAAQEEVEEAEGEASGRTGANGRNGWRWTSGRLQEGCRELCLNVQETAPEPAESTVVADVTWQNRGFTWHKRIICHRSTFIHCTTVHFMSEIPRFNRF